MTWLLVFGGVVVFAAGAGFALWFDYQQHRRRIAGYLDFTPAPSVDDENEWNFEQAPEVAS